MVYDGLGRRITRQEGSATARYHYDADDRLIAISDDSGNWTETIWLEDLPVAQATGSNVLAIHTDQIVQPVRMTNSSGAIVWSRTAQPFGETYAESGAIATVLRFPGQVADATTQTHYNMARDYDPTLGRYLQSDPIGLDGGWNTYGYVGGNPVSRVDPEGLNPTLFRGAVAVGEMAGEGLAILCRRYPKECMATIGGAAVAVANLFRGPPRDPPIPPAIPRGPSCDSGDDCEAEWAESSEQVERRLMLQTLALHTLPLQRSTVLAVWA